MFFKSEAEIKKIKQDNKIEFLCPKCHKVFNTTKRQLRLLDYLCPECSKLGLICQRCGKVYRISRDSFKRNPVEICPNCKNKITRQNLSEEEKQIRFERQSAAMKAIRGNMSSERIELWNQRISQTKKNKSQKELEAVNQKSWKTRLAKYGAYNNYAIIQNSMQEKYGVKSYFSSPDFQEKSAKTKELKYGNPNYRNLEKYEQTCLKKYGVRSTNQVPEIIKKQQQNNHKKYVFDDIIFDSKQELCFYVYCKDNALNISREPEKLSYIFNGKEHFYIPDFLVENQLFEIKGDQFISQDGSWKNIYNPDDLKPLAKYNCALENNVIILKASECQKYIDYCLNKYGKDFINKHKKGVAK